MSRVFSNWLRWRHHARTRFCSALGTRITLKTPRSARIS